MHCSSSPTRGDALCWTFRKIREAYISGVSRRNNEIEGGTAPMRTYAKLNASIMLIVWLCVYPWVFLVWAGIPTAATKHNFNGVLVCFILALIGCGVGTLVAVVLTIVWLVQRAPLYTKSRRVQRVAHVTRCMVLAACVVAGILSLTRYQSAWAYNRSAVTQVAECPRAADAPWPTYMTFADPGVRWHVGPKKSITTAVIKYGPTTFTTVCGTCRRPGPRTQLAVGLNTQGGQSGRSTAATGRKTSPLPSISM